MVPANPALHKQHRSGADGFMTQGQTVYVNNSVDHGGPQLQCQS